MISRPKQWYETERFKGWEVKETRAGVSVERRFKPNGCFSFVRILNRTQLEVWFNSNKVHSALTTPTFDEMAAHDIAELIAKEVGGWLE